MSITVFSEGPLQHILLIYALEFWWCVSNRDKANHSPHLLLEPLSFVSNPVVQDIARKEVTLKVFVVAKQDTT